MPSFIATLQESARDLTPWRHEYRLLFPDGTVTWLFGQAVPEAEPDGGVLWNGVTTDITPRKLVQERLLESEARFRALTELSSDWYWEQDEQFRFVRFEGAAFPLMPHPRAIAVYGASSDPTKIGGRPLDFLKSSGFDGAAF